MSETGNPQAATDSSQTDDRLSSLQKEGEHFAPPPEVLERAHVRDFDELYQRSIADPVAFWEEQARELEWFAPWTQTMQWQVSPPELKWFVGAQCNITVNALDRHVRNGRRNKVAFMWVGEEGDAIVKERTLTYGQL